MTALSSVNLLIAGSNVTVERAVDTIFTSAPVMALLGDLTLSARKLIVALVLAVVVKLLLDPLLPHQVRAAAPSGGGQWDPGDHPGPE